MITEYEHLHNINRSYIVHKCGAMHVGEEVQLISLVLSKLRRVKFSPWRDNEAEVSSVSSVERLTLET